MSINLRDIAHCRSGDKGDTSNMAVFVYRSEEYAILSEHLTVEAVRKHFGDMIRGEVVRYEIPHLCALNFVLKGALGGGVTRSLALDAHGKCLSGVMLGMTLPGELQNY